MTNRFGTPGNDVLTGTSGDDNFWDGRGNDTMFGGYGNDTFFSGGGADTFFGEGGNDTVNYSGTPGTAGVYANLADGLGGEFGSASDHYSSIENITGTNYRDWIVGDANANVLRGLAGDDYIEGGAGGDTLDGGTGVDGLIYSHSTARVVVDLLNNTASGGDATGDTISGFENLLGSHYSDILSGTNGANIIRGDDGSDVINGRGGDDTIDGGRGNDIMTGGSGNDTFRFEEYAAGGADHITDFDVDHDTITFNTYDGGGYTVHLANFNVYAQTVDVIIDFANAGSVTLDHMAFGDVNSVTGRIEIV